MSKERKEISDWYTKEIKSDANIVASGHFRVHEDDIDKLLFMHTKPITRRKSSFDWIEEGKGEMTIVHLPPSGRHSE